jgi:two-component system, LytTR family, response regulator
MVRPGAGHDPTPDPHAVSLVASRPVQAHRFGMPRSTSTATPALSGADLAVVVVEDEPLARTALRDLVGRIPGLCVAGEAADADEAVALIERTHPEIVLLDVQLPGATGFDVLRRVSEKPPAVVFVTAFDDYAVRAFQVHAVDYVLKPYTDARAAEALASAAERVRTRRYQEWNARLQALLREAPAGTNAPAVAPEPRIVVKSVGRTDFVRVADLIWIEARGYYARLHLRHGAILHREPLETLLERLDPAAFVRVHRSAVIRVSAVTNVRRLPTGAHEITLSTGHRVKASRQGWGELRKRLADGGQTATPTRFS